MIRDIRWNKEDKVFDEYGISNLKGTYLHSIDMCIEDLEILNDAGIIEIKKRVWEE